MDIRKIKASQTWKLRKKVMWPTREIEYVQLEDDHLGVHYGLYSEEELISVISLFFDNQMVQLRKFATDTTSQQRGYGSKLLQYVLKDAETLGATQIWCHARIEKVSFYEKFGLCSVGEPFIRDDQEYIRMNKIIQ